MTLSLLLLLLLLRRGYTVICQSVCTPTQSGRIATTDKIPKTIYKKCMAAVATALIKNIHNHTASGTKRTQKLTDTAIVHNGIIEHTNLCASIS